MTPRRPRPRPRASTQPVLAPGQLRALVLDHLRAHPGLDFTPAELANVLHRSRGAIINACRTLTRTGAAVQTHPTPMRFAATGRHPAVPPAPPDAAVDT